jgi:DNA-directed RNA polymerase specialized sigma24 family protein
VAHEASFAELVERLQHNDRAAVGVLIERYGGALRRSIERALWARRLGGSGSNPEPVGAEASDVFQTVLLLFWARLRRQQDGSHQTLHFETPAHLVAYLRVIAQHELVRRRSVLTAAGRVGSGLVALPAVEPASREPTPSQSLLLRELMEHDQAALDEVMGRLSPDERAIWDLVRQELSWPEIARRLGGTSSPEALRKVFARAIRRIAEDLKTWGRTHDEDDRAR